VNQPPQRRFWEQPAPLGITAARESMTGGAAALLAGFSIALNGVIAQAPESIRWPGWSLLLLSMAAISLVTCVQCGFWARAYVYSYQTLVDWRPQPWAEWEENHLRSMQEEDFKSWRRWESRAEIAYHAGIALLAVGVGLTVAPPNSDGEAPLRWAALGIVCTCAFIQVAWALIAWGRSRKP
jgi:hypothetical protein